MRQIVVDNLHKLRIEIDNIQDVSVEKLVVLEKIACQVGKTRIGRISSFLRVENVSYSEAIKNKLITTDNVLKGEYSFILTLMKVINTIGFHKKSTIASNDERSKFNSLIDSKVLFISSEILNTEENKSCNEYPASGTLIACSALMNERNYPADKLIRIAKEHSIIDLFCDEYFYKKSKNRSGSFGAMEIDRILKIAEKLKNKCWHDIHYVLQSN